MSAKLVVTAERKGSAVQIPGSIMLRVRPAKGRAIERELGQGSASIDVPAGEGDVQAVFSSGQIAFQTYSVAEGKEQPIRFVVPGFDHESMAWLSLSRDPSRTPSARPAVRSLMRPTPEAGHSNLKGFALPGEQAAVRVTVPDGSPSVVIRNDLPYAEGRVLHLHDGRYVDVFRQPTGSALALLEITRPGAVDVIRICTLPGPFGMTRDMRETHVMLRTAIDDPLPDVQIVPADQDLAPIVAYLERGNQRALGALRERLVAWAHDAMSEKMSDPISAAIGMAVLLRLGAQDTVRGWSANLANFFPGLPDGGALHAAVLLQQEVGDVDRWHAELRTAVLGACRAGIPLLSDSVRHLRSALSALRGADKSDVDVDAAAAWCTRVARAMNGDLVFTTLTVGANDRALVRGFRK